MPARPPGDPRPWRIDRADNRRAEERLTEPRRVMQNTRPMLRRQLVDRGERRSHRNNRDSLDPSEPRIGARSGNPVRTLLSHDAPSAVRANDPAPAPARAGARAPAT